MDCLARREHSVLELRRKLAARDFDSAEIDTTLAELQADGLLSDARFAEAFVRGRIRRGQGPLKICLELASRGVAGELATEVLAGEDWAALAKAARRKRFGQNPPREYRERARQARFLQQRGFAMEHIQAALGAAADDAD